MKLRMKRKAMVVLAAGMLMSAAAPAAAMAAEKATGPALTASYNGDVNTLEAAKDATQLIVVIGNRQDPAKSRLDWYKTRCRWKTGAGDVERSGQRHERYHDAEAGGR